MNGNQPSTLRDQREKQTSFLEVVNTEKLLWATIQHKGIQHLEVQDLYLRVRSGYEKIILNDYKQVDLQEVEYSLWKLHYKHIDEYRKKIKKVSSGTESTNNLNSHVEGFKLFLSKVAEFYKDLIAKFRKTFVSEETLLKKNGNGDPVSNENTILQKCHYVCHRFLVCLGDLSRYVELCKKPEVQKWGVAATYYLEATTVWPHSGNPQNQLALLATYIGDDFLALYHCIRSLAVKEPFPDARDNIMLLFEKNKSSQLESLSTNAHIDFSKPLKRLSSQIKSHSSMDSTNIKLGGNGNEHVFPVKTDLWPLFVRMMSFFLVKPSFEDLPHTFASTMKELEAVLALNEMELNSSLEPYDQFDSSRKGPYRALQSVAILIFVIHNLMKTPELKELKGQKDEQLSACSSWAWTCMFTCLGHFIQRCLSLTTAGSDRQNCCSLLPAVLVFLEWYVGVIDFAGSYDEDEKVCNAKSYFLGALVDLVSGFDENPNFSNRIALWEDYELRGFKPVSQSNELLDFCNSENRRRFDFGNSNSIRVNRVLHASIKVAEKLQCGSIIYDRSSRKFSKKNEKEIIEEEESSVVEEEEVILFKPLTRYNSEPIQTETETSDQEHLRRSSSLIGAQNAAGPPSLSGWVLNRESLNLERERGSRSPNQRELSPISAGVFLWDFEVGVTDEHYEFFRVSIRSSSSFPFALYDIHSVNGPRLISINLLISLYIFSSGIESIMVGQKLFKTRICVLYRKGQCHRQSCSFAHGDAELRRYNTSSSSFNGRQDYRGADLRDKIGRHRSPPHRNSLDRDARDRIPSQGHSSPRFGKKSEWSHRKRHHFDGESEYSGSFKLSDGGEQGRETKASSTEIKDDQLKHVQSEIDMLEDHKEQLQIYLEERIQEEDSLNSKIKELDMQLSIEKEECRRISSKIRKFVKANHRHSKIQDELKRSEARLERLGDQLGFDARAAANEEDISINILLSDEETLGNVLMSPKYDKDEMLVKDSYSPSKKRMRVHMVDADEKSKQGEWVGGRNMRFERHSRWDPDPHLGQKKNDEIRNVRPFVNNYDKPTRRKNTFTSFPLGDNKFKEAKSTTRMATTFVDEVDEELPLPPPPPLPLPLPIAQKQSAYLQQYKGGKDDDENNVDVVDDDEMLDVDIV